MPINLRLDDPKDTWRTGKTLKQSIIDRAKIKYEERFLEAETLLKNNETKKAGSEELLRVVVERLQNDLSNLSEIAITIDLVLKHHGKLLEEETIVCVGILRDAIYGMFDSIPTNPFGNYDEDKDESTTDNARK